MSLPEYPVTRREQYLSAIAGENTALPDHPVTREEQYLEYIAQNGGGGGSAEIIAPDYSDLTFPVAQGKRCTHGGKLYEANQTISTSEAWTAAHWDETDVDEQLTELSQGIVQLQSGKADKIATVKDTTTADITVSAVKNTNYIYGELTDLTVTWGTGSDNAEISFIFKSGATATTLAVSTTGAKFSSYAPSANAIVEISAKWYLDAWIVIFHETKVS